MDYTWESGRLMKRVNRIKRQVLKRKMTGVIR